MASTIFVKGCRDKDDMPPKTDDEGQSKQAPPSASASVSDACSFPTNKRQRCEAVPGEVVKPMDDDADQGSMMNNENKQIAVYDIDMDEQVQAIPNNFAGSSSSSYPQDEALEDSDDSDNDMEDDYLGDYDYGDDIDVLSDHNFDLSSKFDYMDIPPGVEAPVPWLRESNRTNAFPCKPNEIFKEIDEKFKSFKKFDTVGDFSDNHFADKAAPGKPTKDWVKRIQHEWKLLENDLPGSIFVRVYEERMDLLRAVIVGPAGTPYHDGLFFFDAKFPPEYPHIPPKVHYHSGGLRLNPNLYNCGKVCLSLLGTWSGKDCENWNSTKSSMLQVLISIQALVLNVNPYFNEPGYEATANTDEGKRQALAYNKNTFLLSCKTMLYSLRRPPKHFEDFISGHFRKQGKTILSACRAYMEGIEVGSIIVSEDENEEEEKKKLSTICKRSREKFVSDLQKLFDDLLMELTVKGADCDKFLALKVKSGQASASKS